VMLFIGLADYAFQRFQHEQSLKMTKQEVKDEFKRSEGDPQIKGRIRQRQREMARRRMVQDVAKADVIITNPTHIAVALKYDSNNMGAPRVVAKGQRLLAMRIRAVAEANKVPIVENRPVARLLYKMVEVGQQIPDELYQAVAEILAYVYQLNQRAAGAYQRN
jgi:flagellar biosynthetic protein FlhB